MSPLLEALVAAAKAGFDAPKCARCDGTGSNAQVIGCNVCGGTDGHERGCPGRGNPPVCTTSHPVPCLSCNATGLDASDPFGLIGRAMVWLWAQKRNVTDDEYPNISAAIRDAETGCGMRGLKLVDDYAVKRHDGTVEGIAAALLRLVARVGGAA